MTHALDELILPLPASAEATRLARGALRDRLPDVDAEVVDDVLLIVSELVNNAVQHGRPAIELRLRVQPLAVDVSVLDHGPELPPAEPPVAHESATSGRGLSIIHTLAHAWGVEPLPGGDGKSVWAQLERSA